MKKGGRWGRVGRESEEGERYFGLMDGNIEEGN